MTTRYAFWILPLLAACVGEIVPEESSHGIRNGRPSTNRGVVALLDSNQRMHCSGSIVGCNDVLTAGHCSAAAWVYICDDLAVSAPGCYVRISRVARNRDVDLAVMTTAEPLRSMPILPIASSPVSDAFLGRKLMIYGFAPDNGTHRSEGLMELTSRNGPDGNPQAYTLTTIPQFNQIQQHGDSGGPSMWLGVVTGVQSWTPTPNQAGDIDVGLYSQWIRDQIYRD
jgi:hypothetical protein